MLTVTQTAAARLSQLLGDSGIDRAVRIVRRERGLKLRKDHARPGDVTFAHQGRVVLLLDRRVAGSLSTRTLDVRDTTTGTRLSLAPR
jgi:hypothetical protein